MASDTRTHTATGPLLKRILNGYLRPHIGRISLALVFMGLSAAMTASLARLLQPVFDEVFQAKDPRQIYAVAGAIFVAFTLRGITTYLHGLIMNAVGQRIVATIQSQLYAHLMQADLAFFHANASSQLTSRLINDVSVMRFATAECMTSMGKSSLTLIFLTGVMFYQDWFLASIAFIAFPTAAFFVARIGKKLRRVATSTQVELANFAAILNQTFQGARHVKAYGMERHEQTRVEGIIETLYKLSNKSFRVGALSIPMTEIFSGAAIIGVIVYGGLQVMAGTRTEGQLISFIGAFLFAYEPMKRAGKANNQLQSGLAAAERIFDILDTPPTIVDAPNAKPIETTDYTIALEHVQFAYTDGQIALNDVSLTIPHGQTIALVGASGAGKSTILNLIPRFYDVSGGRVTVGGQDIRTLKMDSLRSHMALVSQETGLFDETIRTNIAYGKENATEAEVIAAAEAAAAHDFISALPDGYDTVVGELGVKLSGGQRQRIAIARAMLRNAPILLLDEATSALDNTSERLVQAGLKALQKGRTTVIVAHRLSTIVDADRIYVLDQGQVAESGTHTELLQRGGLYSQLYRLQESALPAKPAPDAVRICETSLEQNG
jgi:ATP-binding cassette, subfamily B, bacterial MsbA